MIDLLSLTKVNSYFLLTHKFVFLYTPQHQSDCSEWRIKKGGVGHEGCGVVVASGGGFRANRLVGKRVGVMLSRSGTVTEYLCCDASNDVFVLPLSDDVALEDAASWFVDPLTAIAILETAQKHNANAIIQTAAPSLQGQMLIKLAARQGITLVNVVRTRKQWKAFKNMGASLVICTVDPDWTHQLKALIKTLDIRVAFDAIAGDMTGSLLKCLPNRSTVYVHGILTSEPVSGIDPTDLIYRRKQILGFHMAQDWLLMGGPANVSQRIEQNLALIASGLAPDGWATSQFVDCHMDTVQETFCDLWKNGFTGKKLRIRLC